MAAVAYPFLAVLATGSAAGAGAVAFAVFAALTALIAGATHVRPPTVDP